MPAVAPLTTTLEPKDGDRQSVYINPARYELTQEDCLQRYPAELEAIHELSPQLDEIRDALGIPEDCPNYIVGSFASAAICGTQKPTDVDILFKNLSLLQLADAQEILEKKGYKILEYAYHAERDKNRVGLLLEKDGLEYDIASVKIDSDEDLHQYLTTLLSTIYAIEYRPSQHNLASIYNISDDQLAAFKHGGYTLPFHEKYFYTDFWPYQGLRYIRDIVGVEEVRTNKSILNQLRYFTDNFDLSLMPIEKVEVLSSNFEIELQRAFAYFEEKKDTEGGITFFKMLAASGLLFALYPVSWAVAHKGGDYTLIEEIGDKPKHKYDSLPGTYNRFKEALSFICSENGLGVEPDSNGISHSIYDNYSATCQSLDEKWFDLSHYRKPFMIKVRDVIKGIRHASFEPSMQVQKVLTLQDNPEAISYEKKLQKTLAWMINTFYLANASLTVSAEMQGGTHFYRDDLEHITQRLISQQITIDIVSGQILDMIPLFTKILDYKGNSKTICLIRDNPRFAGLFFGQMIAIAKLNEVPFEVYIDYFMKHGEDLYWISDNWSERCHTYDRICKYFDRLHHAKVLTSE